jgi:hypothetical protein
VAARPRSQPRSDWRMLDLAPVEALDHSSATSAPDCTVPAKDVPVALTKAKSLVLWRFEVSVSANPLWSRASASAPRSVSRSRSYAPTRLHSGQPLRRSELLPIACYGTSFGSPICCRLHSYSPPRRMGPGVQLLCSPPMPKLEVGSSQRAVKFPR